MRFGARIEWVIQTRFITQPSQFGRALWEKLVYLIQTSIAPKPDRQVTSWLPGVCPMILTIAASALALQLSSMPASAPPPLIQPVQYGAPRHPPPCGHGWDLSARDGMCYPNGYLAPQEQDAFRRQRHYGGGRYAVRCGHGADLDVRDGQCYPNGMVPPQFQQGRQRYYGDGYHERRPQRRHYYQD
jgi:hypothetical protein